MNSKEQYLLSALVFILTVMLTLPSFANITRSNPYLDLGIFAFEEKDFKSAISHLKRAMLKQPDNPMIYHYLGKTFLDLKRYADAKQYFDQAHQLNPKLEGLLYDRAYLFYLTQDHQQALTAFIDVVQQEPENMLAMYYAAICAFKLNQYNTALKYFLMTANSPNAKENSDYYAAVCYLQLGNIKDARTLFERIHRESHSDALKKDADKWLNYIHMNEKNFRPYQLYMNLSMTYDDNVKLVSPDDTVSDEDDFLVKALVGGTYHLMQSPLFKMGIGYRHFQTVHVDLDEYNLVSSTGEFFLTYHTNDTTLSFYFTPEYYWLDNKSYLSCQRIQHDIQWQKSKDVKLLANIGYAFNHYLNQSEYDGHTTNLGVGIESILPDRKQWKLFAHINAENNSAEGKKKEY